MVKGTMRVGRLFGWHRNFNVDENENVLMIIYYPNDDTELHIQPTPESVDKLMAIRDEIQAIMNRTVELEGNVVERWEKQLVDVPATQVKKWVQTYP